MPTRSPPFAARALAFGALVALGVTAVPAARAADAATKRGERLFLQCRACHSLGTETAGKVGPPLVALLGRTAGAYPEFAYSTALSQAALTWDEATLERWLTSPATLVPGTSMIYAGLPKAEDRRALIAYLRTATQPPR